MTTKTRHTPIRVSHHLTQPDTYLIQGPEPCTDLQSTQERTAFIEKAANSHNPLVDALEKTLEALREYTDGDETLAQATILNNAEAALVQAGSN